MKKYLKILLILLVVAAIGAGIYFYFFTDRRQDLQELIGSVFPTSERTGELPTPGQEVVELKLQLSATTPIFDYWINSDGIIYYLNEFGQVIKRNGETEELLNSQTISGLNKILPSSDGSAIIAKFNYPSSPIFSIFNTDTTNWQPLPAGTIAAAWSPDSNIIIYANGQSLNRFNLDTNATTKIIDLTQKEIDLDWVLASTLLISVPPTIELQSSIWSLNLNTLTLTPIIRNEFGLNIKWYSNSEFGIKLHDEKRQPIISLIDKTGSVLESFNFVTLPSKCLIEARKIYCAVPTNIDEGLELPDDYYKKAVYFSDRFYEIDLTGAGVFELVTEAPGWIMDAEHLEIHNNRLYFKNRLDNGLYSLKIE
jgi:hypothetical protein